MKSSRPTWSTVLVALLVIACAGPKDPPGRPGPPEEEGIVSDADLEAAEALDLGQLVDLTSLDPSSVLVSPPEVTRDGRVAVEPSRALRTQGSSPLPRFRTGAAGSASALGFDDLGGYVAYVEQEGEVYRLRLADLDDENALEEDILVYSGEREIESVAVDRAGSRLAFVARSEGDDHDLFLLDLTDGSLLRTNTPEVDESHVSMSLDGSVVAWQAGTPEAPSIVWLLDEVGAIELTPEAWEQVIGLPLHAAQPSLSGLGVAVAFVETSGALAEVFGLDPMGGIGILELALAEGGEVAGLYLAVPYLSDGASTPSVSHESGRIVFAEEHAGNSYVSLIDRYEGELVDLYTNEPVEHPYLTADGGYLVASLDGRLVAGPLDGDRQPLTPAGDATRSAAYWARGNITYYTGSNSQGTFTRPEEDSLSPEERTVGYHAYEFVPLTTDYYEVISLQTYDGYLHLYEGSFDPENPSKGLLGSNDDYLGPWDDETGVGTSRVVAALTAGERYVIVTSACGDPGAGCGPDQGYFQNLVRDGATPPPQPTVLPEPDDSRFNITLRFWNDSLTDEEKAVFQTAADRWAEVITGDLANIEGFELSEDQVTAGAPGIVGTLDDVIIDAAKVPIDGPGGTLARAGARIVRVGGPDDFLPAYGIMEFDEAEFGPGGFFEDIDAFADTIMHEMGHVLGISRGFWIPLGYISGNPPNTAVCSDVADPVYNDPRYEGPAGNLEWTDTYGADSDKVPIANTNGCGTADSHWREIYLQDELMTGYANGTGDPLSRVTIGALEDLGYQVDYGAADDWSIPPLPRLAQVEPDAVEYRVEFDFGEPFTNSLPGEVTAPVTAVDIQPGLGNTSSSGCEPSDFDDFPEGHIALLQRGTCAFGIKAQNALNAGAVAVLIGNQGDTEGRKAPVSGTFGDTPIPIVGVPISYDLMIELSEIEGLVMLIDTDTLDGRVLAPQARPRVAWHLAEVLLPIVGGVDPDGNFTYFGD